MPLYIATEVILLPPYGGWRQSQNSFRPIRFISEAESPPFAKPLDLGAFLALTLPRADVRKVMSTVEQEVAAFSRDGDITTQMMFSFWLLHLVKWIWVFRNTC